MEALADGLVIDPRFTGPPDSANGGYACGSAAVELVAAGLARADSPIVVRLHLPPPLGERLEVRAGDGRVELVHDGRTVATAAPGDDLDDPPPAPTAGAVDAAVEAFDEESYAASHPFVRCFTCGPHRGHGDGLRLFPAPLEPGRVAWPWSPTPSMSSDGELVDVPVVWAALDCPSGLTWIWDPERALSRPAVLGQLTAQVHRRPAVREPLVVGGWRASAEGRKLVAGSAVWSTDGEVLARAHAVWIELQDDQLGAFGAGRG